MNKNIKKTDILLLDKQSENLIYSQIIKNFVVSLTERYRKDWTFYKLKHCIRSTYTIGVDTFVIVDEY